MRFLRVYKKKALTLIEVVISLAILFIIMIPISTMAIQTVKMNKQAEDKQQATALAQKLMEKVKSLPKFSSGELTDGVTLQVGSSPYRIQGEIDGFKVEGTIEAVEGYSSELGSITNEVDADATVELPKEDANGNLYVIVNGVRQSFTINFKELSIVKDTSDTKLIFSNGTTAIPNDKSAIEIIADKDSSLNYTIKVSNNTNTTLNLYCYKFNDSNAKFNVINEKGKVSYYDNLLKQDSSTIPSTINRVYNINIKVSKKDTYYEVKSNKAMVR